MLKTQVIGHIGNDAVVKEVNGKSVINFSVAHSEKYKNSEGVQMERTTWVSCAYWNERAAVAPYLKKGVLVFCEGQPDVDVYTNKQGQPTGTIRLRVSQLQLLGGGTRDNNQANNGTANNGIPVHSASHTTNGGSGFPQPSMDDDLPF